MEAISVPSARRIWDIPAPLKCPVAGLCLTIDEHRRILKKCGFPVKGLNHYELHQAVMNHLNDENPVSQRLNRYLDYKYRSDLSFLNELNVDGFMAVWRERLAAGRMEGIFWAAAGRRDLSEESLVEIYGEVHMAGHTGAADAMTARRDLARQVESHRKTVRLLHQEKLRFRSLKGEMAILKKQLGDVRNRLEGFLSSKKAAIPDPKGDGGLLNENRLLVQKIFELEGENLKLADQARVLEREKRRLQIEYFDIHSTNQLLADEIKNLLTQLGPLFECGAPCGNHCMKFQLCARRILIVGGITKMRHLYRDLIESCGGEFDYHDGCIKPGVKKLEAQVGRSDIVLCPVNCNSHGACEKVKSLCKKLNKPVRMLPQSSLSNISGALMSKSA
jgi:hypothetical protein